MVENGQSPAENQVSRTSGSRVRFSLAHFGHCVGSSSATISSSQSSQYQAGIWWPHHNWRLMHQGRILYMKWSKVFFQTAGMISVRPDSTASVAFFAIGSALTNHWSIGSE